MLAFRPDPVFVRQRHRVLHEADLDSAGHLHLGTEDPGRFFAALLGIGANQGHRVDVGTAEAALPVLRRMRSDIAYFARTAPHPTRNALGKLSSDGWESPSAFSPS